MFGSFAFIGPFAVLYYQELGFSGAQIGLISGITPLITLVASPFWTGLADTRRLHRPIMSLNLLVVSVIIAVFPFLRSFAPILVLAISMQFFFSAIAPLVDSATMHMLGAQRELYGRVRLGGTFGYGIAAALAGGLVQNTGLRSVFWVSSALMFLTLLVSQKLEYSTVQSTAAAASAMRKLLTSPRWLLFLVVAFANGLGIAATNTYLFPFLRELNTAAYLMGLILTVGTISEIPVLFFGNRLVRHFTPYRLFILGTLVTGTRFLFFALADTPYLILFLQLFSGLAFGAMWMGAVAYAQENAPPGLSASAQGQLGAMVFGFGAAAGGISGGLLLDAFGGSGLYLVFGLAILLITALAVVLKTRIPPVQESSPTPPSA